MDMQDELMDRFGDIPKSVENLLVIARVRALAHKCYVTEILVKKRSETDHVPEGEDQCRRHTGSGKFLWRCFKTGTW